jgi:phosphatidyl-myo-inositol dimannoside synthase
VEHTHLRVDLAWRWIPHDRELVVFPVTASRQSYITTGKAPARASRVLLLAPSRGLGGGIERYMETLEWGIAAQGISCQRLDLSRAGVRAHAAMLVDGRTLLRASPEPVRLVIGHRALLPVATLLARDAAVCGISVLCHGTDVWGARPWLRRRFERSLMRRAGVQVVAVSTFTAGALVADCHATILPPALSQEWFGTLIAAGASVRRAPGIHLATAFRLAVWREKGLPQLIEAVTAVHRGDIRLTICGEGDPPADLLQLVANHTWCTLRAGLTDGELALQLAAADIFVLATRTRPGRHFSGEGFGLVLLEAQVAGTPVIAPAYGGSSDAYVEGITGVAPEDETVEALARTLDEMLGDPVRLTWMGKRAAEWARESFAPERYAHLVARRLL